MNIFNVLLLGAASVLWMWSMACLGNLHGSDAAGNGLAIAFGVIASIALWIVLLILLSVSAAKGGWPAWTIWAAFVLVPACATADFIAINLLNDTFYKAKWPIVIPQVAPWLLIAYAVWAYYPSLRALLPSGITSAAVWGAILILSLLPWPQYLYRSKHRAEDQARAEAEFKASEPQRIEAARQARLDALNKLGPDSDLHEYLDFAGPQDELREQAFERIRHLERRQSDAEALFREGYIYLERDLPELDLQATPPICEGALKYFLTKLDDLRPRTDDPHRPFKNVQEFIVPYMPGLKWMVEHKCDCGATLDEMDKIARGYDDSPERTQFLAEIAGLRRLR
jgi:hypothetical protein